MTQAESIRRHVLARHVAPARAAGVIELAVRAGDLCAAMGFRGRTPNVCNVLGSRRFHEMAGLRLLERVGPRQSTTTTFRYAIVEREGSVAAVPSPSSQVASSRRTVRPASNCPATARAADPPVTVVISCASAKSPSAGHLALENGRRVLFVADPKDAPRSENLTFKHPDDPAGSGLSWRQVLVEHNGAPANNPRGLLPAWKLYRNRVYSELVDALGVGNVFILSAGWGLVSADFLLPNYDITFSKTRKSDAYKRRREADHYDDFSMRPRNAAQPVIFLGGEKYVSLFCRLTRGVESERIVFHNTADPPHAPGCELRRFGTAPQTNWQYACARAVLRREIDVRASGLGAIDDLDDG